MRFKIQNNTKITPDREKKKVHSSQIGCDNLLKEATDKLCFISVGAHASKGSGCCASWRLIFLSGELTLLSQEGGVSWKVTAAPADQTLTNCLVVCLVLCLFFCRTFPLFGIPKYITWARGQKMGRMGGGGCIRGAGNKRRGGFSAEIWRRRFARWMPWLGHEGGPCLSPSPR